MPWTDDPIADFARHDAMQQKRLEQFPECSDCGVAIQDKYFEFDCYFYCSDCVDKYHKKDVEDFVGG